MEIKQITCNLHVSTNETGLRTLFKNTQIIVINIKKVLAERIHTSMDKFVEF